MSDTLTYILEKFNITLTGDDPLPIVIPNYGRAQLASLFAELGFTTGAEIGVKCGEYSEVLLKANPNLCLYGVDPYLSYEAYRTISQQQQDDCYAEAMKRLVPYISDGRYRLIKANSVDVAKGFNENQLDFCFVDASHKFEDVTADIAAWSQVVRPGGLICGHDYLRRQHGRDGGPNVSHHVKQAVDAWTDAYGINPYFVLGRKQARLGEVRDKERSYMWIKK